MPSHSKEVCCTYHYDPLDQLIGLERAGQDNLQRFYCKSRLATEIQGHAKFSIMQHGNQLLAQQQRQGDTVETDLLVTDQQRSVLHTVSQSTRFSMKYLPYGYLSAGSGLASLLGFNGERRDAITGRYLLGNGHRAFNAVLMRFDSPDVLSPFGEGGRNAYAYCLGDPVNRSDPTGNFSLFWIKKMSPEYLRKQVAGMVGKKWYDLTSGEIAISKNSSKNTNPFVNRLILRDAEFSSERPTSSFSVKNISRLKRRMVEPSPDSPDSFFKQSAVVLSRQGPDATLALPSSLKSKINQALSNADLMKVFSEVEIGRTNVDQFLGLRGAQDLLIHHSRFGPVMDELRYLSSFGLRSPAWIKLNVESIRTFRST